MSSGRLFQGLRGTRSSKRSVSLQLRDAMGGLQVGWKTDDERRRILDGMSPPRITYCNGVTGD